MIYAIRTQRQARSLSISRSILMSASYFVLSVTLCAPEAMAQAAAESGATPLPPVVVATHKPKARRRGAASRQRTDQAAAKPKPETLPDTQDSRTGTAGYVSNSTSVATKSNTPLINIPQSVSVLTKNFIKDQAPLGLTDVTRYVPGVAVHQGEGNRDELVIRGVDSSANFFVNGVRDDVQIFRDLYNTQSIEIVKGPSALTFGRGAGGGLLNRTLKEADGTRLYEATVQSGSYGDRRISIDAGQAVNDSVAVRFNAFYEGSETFRDFGNLERYGFNPTVTLKPNDTTKIKLSYEYYHDERTADRGNPSQGLPGVGATRFNPTTPFAPNGDLTTFFGSPIYNVAKADVQTSRVDIEHDFENGLTVKNSSVYADYNKFYQNVYPGGAVNTAQTSVALNAYQHWTDRDNAINQTDFTYKTSTGPLLHTIGFGTEFDRQTGIDLRNTGIFAGTGTNSVIANPFDPTFFGAINFIHHPTAINTDGVTSADSNSKYALNTQSAYARDQIEVTRWLQVIGGVRYDRFDMSAVDRNTGIQRARVDEKLSPQAAVIVKPMDNLSVYAAYSVSYLPASGDQFSALNDGTLILEPQKFENTEVGVKWNITPKLQFTSAVYELNRTNQPITDPVRGSPFAFPNGATKVRGFETALNGYVTDAWQSSIGYAYTDARIAKDLTPATTVPPILAGNRVQLVPYNQFSWWNKYQIDPIWGAGLGIIYFSDSYAASDDTVRLPGFVRFDAALYVKINETWRGQLNIENIFDKGYWASADGNNNISPGQPRTFKVSATAKF